jgi:hypothetical protein
LAYLPPIKIQHFVKTATLLKNGPTFHVSNYHPISLLSIFNKILEKLMYKRLINFLEKNKLLFHGQFGFWSNHSTNHALLLITDKMQRAILKT